MPGGRDRDALKKAEMEARLHKLQGTERISEIGAPK